MLSSAPHIGIGLVRTSGASSPGIPIHISWQFLNNIIMIADQFMDPKVYHLFKHSGYDEALVALFKSTILPMVNSGMTHAEVKQIVERILKAQPIKPSAADLSHALVRLIKTTLKESCIANSELVNEIDAACAWHIFMKELKVCQDNYESTLKSLEEWERPKQKKKWEADYDFLPRKPIQQCFLNYLGHLCVLRNIHITKAFHNIFYLLNKVAKQKKSNSMTRRELGAFIAGNFLYALVRNQFPQDEVDNLTIKECNYFAKICEYMVKHPIFANPFRVEDYAIYSQSHVAHREIRPYVIRCLFPSKVLTFGAEVKKENAKENTVVPQSDEIKVLNPITASPHILARAKKVLKHIPLVPRLRFDLDDKVNDKAPTSLPLKLPPLTPPPTAAAAARVDDVIAELKNRLILNSYDTSKEKEERGQQATPRRKDTKDDLKKEGGPKP